jgi:hypothetical protein
MASRLSRLSTEIGVLDAIKNLLLLPVLFACAQRLDTSPWTAYGALLLAVGFLLPLLFRPELERRREHFVRVKRPAPVVAIILLFAFRYPLRDQAPFFFIFALLTGLYLGLFFWSLSSEPEPR